MSKNTLEDGMKVASAIYHLNTEGVATKQELKKHPLLKNISRTRLEYAFQSLLNFGAIQIRLNDAKNYVYYLTYPETIEQYMRLKGWLVINKTFKFKGEKC